MVLDLMAQLDREFIERSKIEALLRELLDSKRNRKSEQLSADQLALFAAVWQARQAEPESPAKSESSSDDDAAPGSGSSAPPNPQKRTGGRQALPRHLKRERIVHDLAKDDGRLAGPMRRSAEAAIRIGEGSSVPVESDRDRRYRSEGTGCQVAVRAHRTDLAVLRG